ncbi:MAG: CCA tRNA nucleotidyltransferase [Desulfosarcina sp.]|nr:CCA tRNA nucleotidyltransferase [Desulfosarcina sp.]MBC2745129.1 CCA tRNA nucleotidyltransferase [Desulfosarcina sp.]MBC2768036.1 CCA tRNA nucleotidyltransferase [Desulfosarcina sp.]
MTELADINLDFLPDNPDGVYLVGGTVRDLLAGHPPADIDLVVNGDIAHAARQIAEKTGGRIIDLGKKGFNVLRVASPNTTIDITPLDHPSIEANLLQRDFTINAMAYDVKARRLVDCTGGLADMQQKMIRMVSPSVFENDPARLVRAYRMAAVFHFSISAKTQDTIGSYRHLVGTVAGERVWVELIKIFNTADSTPTIMSMADSGLLTAIFPELQPAIGCTQNRHHQFDVFDHSLRAYEKLETLLAGFGNRFPDLAAIAKQADLSGHAAMLKYGALLHDVGKPATRQVDNNGRVRFPGHAGKSADIAARISRRLRLSKKQRDVSDAIIRHHIRTLFLFLSSENGSLGRRGIIRFFNRCGDLTLPIIVHTMADIMAKGKVLQDRDNGFISFCDRLINVYIDYKNRQATLPPLISGHDLISVFGLSPSPRFKQILKQVDERRLSGELATRDQALAWVSTTLISKVRGRRSDDRSRNSEP